MSEAVTLSSRAKELVATLDTFGALKDTALHLSELQHRQLSLEKELQRLTPATEMIAAARERDPGLPLVSSAEVGKALDWLDTVAQVFAQDPNVVVRSEFKDGLQAVKKAVSAVEMHGRALWQQLAVPVRDEVKLELLHALARIAAWSEVVSTIRALQGKLDQLAVLPLASREQFDAFFRLADERNTAWQGLHGAKGIPPSVVEFLRACVKDGVPLNAVSGEVTAWLAERDILQYFRVRL